MEALYRRDGERFVPSAATGSPWSARGQHGGPPSGLIARAVERWSDDAELQLTRLTIDLFRQVPMAPLAVRVEPLRQGRRLVLLNVSLYGDDREVSRATALLLRRSTTPEFRTVSSSPPRIEQPSSSGLVPAELRDRVPEGFHTHIEVSWVPAAKEKPPSAWLRLPMSLVDGEETSPLQRAAAVSDFCNALAARTRHQAGEAEVGAGGVGAGYINTDTTLYLARPPVGDWICLEIEHVAEAGGIGLVDAVEHDERGRFGRCVQARLAQSAYPRDYGEA